MMKPVTAMLLVMLCATAPLFAQESKPGIQVFTTEFTRIHIVRMDPGTDLLEGLHKAVRDHRITNGVILGGIGSVTDYHYHVVSDKGLPPAGSGGSVGTGSL